MRRRTAPGHAGARGVAILAVAIAAIWTLSGVSLDDALRFTIFEVFYVLLPGSVLCVVLSPATGDWLSFLTIAWPCGYAVEVGAFALTAALHARGAFALLPLGALGVGASLFVSARGRRHLDTLRRSLPGRDDPVRVWDPGSDFPFVALAVGAGLLVLALVFFASSPLPAGVHSIYYYPDNVADISWTAEARHHWPIEMPWVAGQPAHYYLAAFFHMAAVKQVSGVSIATVVLRLFPTVMILVIALQLWSISRRLGCSRWAGPVALVLFFVVADLNLDPTRPVAFAADVANTLPRSPTYALGAVFFLGLLSLVQRRLTSADAVGARTRSPRARIEPRRNWGALVLLSIFAIGAGATKASAVADFLGVLALYWFWHLAVRRVSLLLSYALAVTAGSFIAIYLLMLRGGNASNLGLHPFDFLRDTVVGPVLSGSASGWLALGGRSIAWYVLLVVAFIGVCLCMFVPLLGAVWLLYKRQNIAYFTFNTDFARFCVVTFVVALAAFVALGAPGTSQGYFLAYGYIAMVPVAAAGLVGLWTRTPPRARGKVIRACAAVLALGLVTAASTRVMTGAGSTAWHGWYVAAYGTVAVAVAIAVVWLRRGYDSAIPSLTGRVLACSIPLLCTLGLVKPIAEAAPMAWDALLRRQASPVDSSMHYGMTATLYQGLTWVRNHTTTCDVIAVNNHYSRYVVDRRLATSSDSYYPYYSAFTERRVFLESWYQAPGGELGGQPYPARLALNDLATMQGSPAALQQLARDGVSYVLIDKTHGAGAPEPASVSRLEFDNSALSVYHLRTPPPRPAQIRPRCGEVSGV